MKLGIVLRTTGPTPRLDLDFVLEAERLGFDSAWTSEAWGGDAVTTVSWLLACTTKIKGGTGIMQMQARTPMVVVLNDGEELHGVIEWYDRSCIKLNRGSSPHLLLYKPSIRYIYKAGEVTKP